MKFTTPNGTTWTILLFISSLVAAQSNTVNQNITVRFFQTSQEGSCSYSNTSNALTFTTSSIPVISHCFDFAELFGGNASQGFVNQTRNLAPGSRGQAGISWQLENRGDFDPQTNYSSVLYRQHLSSPANDDQKPGRLADRRVTIYGGKDCTQKDPNSDEALLPWYGFSCWSEEQGSCGTAPYKIASFSIQAKDEQQGKCWVFARDGAAVRATSASQALAAALVSATLAVWLTL